MSKEALFSKEEITAKAAYHYNRGVAFFEKKQPTRALIEFTISLDTKPSARAYEKRSLYHAMTGDLERMIQDTTSKQAMIEAFEHAFEKGMKLQLAGKDKEAYVFYSHALDQGLRDHDFLAHVTRQCAIMQPKPPVAPAVTPVARERSTAPSPVGKMTISVINEKDESRLWKPSERNLSVMEQVMLARKHASHAPAVQKASPDHLHPSQAIGKKRWSQTIQKPASQRVTQR